MNMNKCCAARGGVPSASPSLPHPSPFAQIYLLLCLDETGAFPWRVGYMDMLGFAVDYMGFHNPYQAGL